MPFCLVIGDSIAVGIAAALSAIHFGGCEVRARVGASVDAIASMAPSSSYDVAIISAGTNDTGNRNLSSDLGRLRRSLNAKSVTWIYPRAAAEAWSVYRIAQQRKDRTVGFFNLHSDDGIHPTNYAPLIRMLFRVTSPKPTAARP
jgi:lysophospholipase L1-like esterase